MKEWTCNNCAKQFPEVGDGFCPCCGNEGILVQQQPVSQAQSLPVQEQRIMEMTAGEHGLGILVLDFSQSMGLDAFPEGGNPASKIDVVAKALSCALSKLKTMSRSNLAYVALIGFSKTADLLGVYRADSLSEESDYWENFIRDQYANYCDITNLTDALYIAYDLYSSALDGSFAEKFKAKGFSLGVQEIALQTMEIKHVPNVRIFIYSDGCHNVHDFQNPFANSSIIPGLESINGIISAFFGTSENRGFSTMKEIAGICPVHGHKGFIHIESPHMYPLLRYLFHMTSAHSGFCPSCAKVWQEQQG